MSIHYKFKSALDFDTVTFDGLHISVGDLKKAIIHQKRLGKVTDFDLQITNAQTKEEYEDDSCLIPKNTSLVIARIPLTHQPKKTWSSLPDNSLQARIVSKLESTSLDLSKMKGTEEEKIQAMMLQSTVDYDPKSYHRIRGQSQTGEVPATYRCNKCKKGGHWIKNCTVVIGKDHMDIKRNTGIPKSFRDKDGKAPVLETPDQTSAEEKTQEIPDDLLCSICNDLFVDAVMIPCCGSSFCDDCVRTALLESEDNECPDCKEKGSSPGSLIPNRFLRNSVNAFRNETGYNAAQLQKALHANKPNESLEDNPQIMPSNVPELLSKPYSKSIEEDITEQTNLREESPTELESNKNSHRKVETPSYDDIDSDFEDNITVMMPPAKIKSPHAVFRERPYNGRSSRHPKPPGIESSPRNHLQVSPLRSYRDNKHKSPLESNNIEWERECDRERDYHEQLASLNPLCQSSNLVPHYSSCKSQVRPVRPLNPHDVFSGPPNRINTYPQVPTHPQIMQVSSVQGPSMGSFDNIYNQIGPRTNLGYSHCMRPMFHNTSSGYMSMRGLPTDPIQPLHTNNLASVYQGVAAKVGTGIIDDPLEAFNRLMKEKEKRKEERRRSHEHRRSRSIERQQTSRFRSSPYDRKTEKKDKEKPLRIRDQRLKHGFEKRHEMDKSFSHRYSQSFSDRSSRSRSWSNSPHKKCSKSPVHNRRSRSRTHTIGEKKRHMEKRYSLRKEDDLRYQSPNLRRSRSRERSHIQHHANWYSQHVSSTHSVNKFKREIMRSPYKRSLTPQLKREQQNAGSNLKRIEGSLLEILEPPPPGFEGNPSQDCNNWTILQQDPIKLPRRRTPDLYEKCVSQDVDDKNVYGSQSNFNRSCAKYANQTSDKNKRHARSRTPTSKPPATNADKLKETINRRLRRSPEGRKREKVNNDIEKNAKYNKEPKRDRSKELENIEEAINENEISKQEEEGLKYVISEKCENQFSGKGIDRHLKSIDLDNEKTKKSCLKNEEKLDKKLKYRKKKRREKSERKKLKKDKKDKRERDKEKNSSEQQQNDETIKTPDINVSVTAMEEHRKLEESFENVPAVKWNPEAKYVCKETVEDGEIIDGSINGTNNVIHQMLTKKEATIESDIKRVDSILDIHGYETDFDETNSLDPRNKTILIAPEPSKWERDEQVSIGVPVINHYHENICFSEESREKVTNEVLRKAENAIFARAINAIRPIEVKNTNAEYQEIRSTSPQMSAIFQNNSKENMKSFKITVPLSNSQERSVEIKGDSRNKSRSPKPTKSVKDRLGSKIVNKKEFSRNNDMQNNRGANRSRSRDRHPSLNKTSETYKERLEDHRTRYRDRARNRDREGFNKRFEEYKPSRTLFNSIADRRQGDDVARKFNTDHLSHRSLKSSKSYKSENNDGAGSRHNEKSGIYRKEGETLCSELKQKKSTEHKKSENKPAVVSNFRNEENEKNPICKNESTDTLRCLDRDYEVKWQPNITDAESYTESLNTDSDSEDLKRRKRHKYKKDKKRIKRSSSRETAASAKKKHIKSKKKNKSAKKKKKNKK